VNKADDYCEDVFSIPIHVAFIMDGNRRFAKRLMKQPWKGHEWGAKKVREVARWCRDKGIKYATFYGLSIENLYNRPKKELEMLMKIFKREFSSIPYDKEIHRNEVRVNVIGRIDLLPSDVQEAINEAVESTKHYDNYVVTFAIAYGGRQEIVDAVKKLVEKGNGVVDKLTPESFSRFLYTSNIPDPDLVIRTSGEKRISGFLLWQIAYSELFFTEELWPEFKKETFEKAINDFMARERRFGR